MIGIFLTVFNQIEDTKITLKSLENNTLLPYKLVIVDDMSTDGTMSYLRQHNYMVIQNAHKTSQSFRYNQGIRFLLEDPKIKYIVSLHNDMTFYPKWLERLINEYKHDDTIGKLSAANLNLYGNDNPVFADQFMNSNKNQYFPGNGGPWIMSRDVIDKVGYFDESFVGCGGYEDWDYNNRVLNSGLKVMITNGSAVWHPGMGTRKHYDNSSDAITNANIYFHKWGTFNPLV
ncbi:glycosyltransferase family 2 protein [Fictibacillus fluitans]|uniref:Glycosyltransferase n=1 Tax=Fictibacillus fluitans TaxID=3058422 RepID=A0ABT8HS84_9BACL|nr:glycosyltransferase [Fictibacillus sp. NE201]MDN4523632.1 glycosyltransferase [Fictibacillus sp. NE201]